MICLPLLLQLSIVLFYLIALITLWVPIGQCSGKRMESRKIINLNGSKVVALPPDWLRASHLGCGDSVEVVSDGPLVIIRPVKGT
jgi:hypothetical protein